MAKKMFQPAFGCAQHPKAGQNTQQTSRDSAFAGGLSIKKAESYY